MYRRQPSVALPLSTRAVTAPEPDVLVTHLAIRRAGDAQRARLGMNGLADNGCARALFGSVIHRLPAGAARRCSAPRPRPDRFSCLASAAGCYCLFIDSSERAWGSRRHSAPQRPRLDPRRGYPTLTVAYLHCLRLHTCKVSVHENESLCATAVAHAGPPVSCLELQVGPYRPK